MINRYQHPYVKERNVGDPGNILSHLANKWKECQQKEMWTMQALNNLQKQMCPKNLQHFVALRP